MHMVCACVSWGRGKAVEGLNPPPRSPSAFSFVAESLPEPAAHISSARLEASNPPVSNLPSPTQSWDYRRAHSLFY